MDKELEAREVFNKKYPKEKRCGKPLFDDGLFERGFIAGFLAAQKPTSDYEIFEEMVIEKFSGFVANGKYLPADIAKATNDNFKDLLPQ